MRQRSDLVHANMRPILISVFTAISLAACGHQQDGDGVTSYLPAQRIAGDRERERQAESQREYDQWREADRLRDLCYRSSDSRTCPR